MVTPLNEQVLIQYHGIEDTLPYWSWVREMKTAIAIRERALAEGRRQPQTDAERVAAYFLKACLPSLAGDTTQEKIDGFLQRLDMLDAPSDKPKTVRCSNPKCGRLLHNKISVALGIGPECRTK